MIDLHKDSKLSKAGIIIIILVIYQELSYTKYTNN